MPLKSRASDRSKESDTVGWESMLAEQSSLEQSEIQNMA